MAKYYTSVQKNCATCAYWTGKRKCDSFGQRVMVQNAMERGKCAIPRGGWMGLEKLDSGQCKDWQKWAALR